MTGRVALPTDEIAAICRRFGVERLDLVGSGARGTDFDAAQSDLDFVVSFQTTPDRPTFGDFLELEAALEAAIGRKVDLIAAGSVRNPYMRASMDEDGVTVHEA